MSVGTLRIGERAVDHLLLEAEFMAALISREVYAVTERCHRTLKCGQ